MERNLFKFISSEKDTELVACYPERILSEINSIKINTYNDGGTPLFMYSTACPGEHKYFKKHNAC
jgi:hypothetical protein